MTDTPLHIKELQKKKWQEKTPEERLYQFIMDNDASYKAFREFKIANGLPLGDLDPLGQLLTRPVQHSKFQKQANSADSN